MIFLLTILLFISIFVGGILLCFWSPVVFQFMKEGNSSDFLEKKNLEVLWTLLPFLILIIVGVYSLHLLYHTDVTSKQIIDKKKIKIIGHQWYWTYDYDLKTKDCRWPETKDHFVYDRYMLKDQDLILGRFRKLTVDKPLVIKINHVYNIRTTSRDVIHSFSIPNLGIKIDRVPGRLKETKFLSLNTGVFFWCM